MRAVNLVPADARPGRVNGGKSGGAVYAVLGVLVVLLLGMSVLAITKRDAAEAEQELAAVQQSTQAYSSAAAQFSSFEQAADQAAQRITTVRGLADARFDWAGTLRDMSRLIPAETQILQLSASISSNSGAGGASDSMRSALDTPAVSLTGCSQSQSTVANLVNQLQAMRRVTNVTLSSSEQSESAGADDGASCTLSGNPFNFSLVVFMAPGTAQSSGTVVPQTTPPATPASATSTDSSAAATSPAATTGGTTP